MKTFFRGVITIVLFFTLGDIAAAEGDKCSTSAQFQCPNPENCPDSGYSYVSACLECDGHLNTYFEGKQCFDRKLLNGKDNPSKTYLYRDIVGIIIWFIAAGLATACGVGGGGIYVPLGILLLAFAPKPSSGLSQASIFGASLGGLILNIRNKHPFTTKIEDTSPPEEETGLNGTGTETISSVPTQDETPTDTETCHYYTRPVIDYNMALFLAPMEMAGAVLGVVIQTVLPNWLYLMISAVILGLTAKKTYSKWWEMRKKECAQQEAGQQQQSPESAASKPNLKPKVHSSSVVGSTVPTVELDCSVESAEQQCAPNDTVPEPTLKAEDEISHSDEEEQEPDQLVNDPVMDAEKIARRDYLLQQDARQYPKEKIMVFVILWAGLTLLTFFKGGKGVDSLVGITCESPWYGVLIALQFLWTLGFSAYYGWKLPQETEEKKSVGYPFHPEDVMWDYRHTRFYAAVTFLAGIVAGLIGIGGGMVLGPLMIIMNVNPRVSTATTATMIVLTSSSVAVLFVTSGLVPWQYAICFFSTCFVGAYVGKKYIDGYIKRTGKSSILVCLLATIITFATIGTLVIVFTRLADANWCFAGFNQFCKVSHEDAPVNCVPADGDGRLLQGYGFYEDVVHGVSSYLL